ncbi:MAG TPA: GNAT family N-acetyltransferase [Rudaea sp.]|nr:GNAT family N-acetyltransferase [Rudaea sp.]
MILTPRLRLRALTLSDLVLFRALYCDPGTMRHVGKPMSRARAAASLGATIAATRKPGNLRFFVIAERKSRRGVGMCSIRPAVWDKCGAEAGLMLLLAVRGHGYAREALAALIDDAFSQPLIDAVWVQYRRANLSMARLCDSLGFDREFSPHAGKNFRRCVRIPRRPERRNHPYQPARGATMSNIIGFLEQAGRDAAMRHASREVLLQAMRDEEIIPEQRNALLQSQSAVLGDLIGARETMYCKNTAIKPPKKKPAKKAPAKKPAKKAPAKRKK